MKIKEIKLCTQLPEELKSFYVKDIGLELLSENANSFSIRTLSTIITFQSSEGSEKPFYHFAFNIPENKFNEAKKWALKKFDLIKLNGEDEFDFKSWNAHSIYFYDPAGNILELIARHNLNNKSQNNFTGKDFLNLSEIGMPVYDVKKFYDELNSLFKIPIFSGDLRSFTAAGDDEGLFIIVPEKRSWFPDCDKAKIFPLSVTIISDIENKIEFQNLPYKIISELESPDRPI